MPTATKAPPKATPPDYWEDWELDLSPEVFSGLDRRRIGRDELLTLVAAMGATVTDSNLRYWEDHRWLPLPRRAGFPARTVYPAWIAPIIASTPTLRDEGKSWEEIRQIARQRPVLAHMGDMIRLHGGQPPPELAASITTLANEHRKRIRHPVAKVEIVLRDPDGLIVGRYDFDTRETP